MAVDNADLFQRFAFDELRFPVTESSQQGSRAVAEHEAWRRDGAELVDGGRKAFRGKVTGAFFDTFDAYPGLYPDTFQSLLVRFWSVGYGRLSHPILGTFDVMVPSWEPRITAGATNGAWVDFEWVEQRASSVGVIDLSFDRGAGDPRTEVAAQAETADAALAAVGAGRPVPLAATTDAALAVTSKPLTAPEVGRALSPLDAELAAARAAVDAVTYADALALPLWRARAAVTRLRAAVGRLRAALLPDPARARVFTTTRPMTVAELSHAVYGTPFRAADLRAANALAADLVRAGRTLTVLP